MKKLLILFLFIISYRLQAQWSGAAFDSLTNNNAFDWVEYHCLEIDSSGYLHIVYPRPDSGLITGLGWNIIYRRRDLTGTWSAEDTLFKRAFHPSIGASNIPGEAYIAFDALAGNYKQIFVCSNHGGAWNCQQITNDEFDNIQPDVIVDQKNGNTHVAWVSLDAQSALINYAKNSSSTWQRQIIPNSFVATIIIPGCRPQIGVDYLGRAHIAYSGYDNTTPRINYMFNDSSGGFQWHKLHVTTPNTNDNTLSMKISSDSTVHLLVSGNFQMGSLPAKAFYFSKYVSDTTFSLPVAVGASFSADAADIFVDDNNTAHCVLNEYVGNNFQGNVFYANQNNWSGYMLLNSSDINNASLVIDHSGNGYLAASRGFVAVGQEVVVNGGVITTGIPGTFSSSNNNNVVKIYPTGTSYLNIEIKDETKNAELSICDIRGKEFKHMSITENNFQLNIDDLPTGFFFLNLFIQGKLLISQKISHVK